MPRALPPGGADAGRGDDVAQERAGPPRAGRAVLCRSAPRRAAPAGWGPDPGLWRQRSAPTGGARAWRRRRRRRLPPSGAVGAACCAAGTWRLRRWAAVTTRCATAAPPRCGCCVSSATAPFAARSCVRCAAPPGGAFRAPGRRGGAAWRERPRGGGAPGARKGTLPSWCLAVRLAAPASKKEALKGPPGPGPGRRAAVGRLGPADRSWLSWVESLESFCAPGIPAWPQEGA